MHGSTGGDWKRNARPSPRQSPTQPTSSRAQSLLEAIQQCTPGEQIATGGTQIGCRQRYGVGVEEDVYPPSAQPSDLALNATFIAHSGLLSALTDSSNHSRLSKVQTTLAPSRQARDEALLAFTAESHERRISNDKSKSPNSEFELH